MQCWLQPQLTSHCHQPFSHSLHQFLSSLYPSYVTAWISTTPNPKLYPYLPYNTPYTLFPCPYTARLDHAQTARLADHHQIDMRLCWHTLGLEEYIGRCQYMCIGYADSVNFTFRGNIEMEQKFLRED